MGWQWHQLHSLTFRVRRCCHSNETGAPIANLPNCVQLEGTLYYSPSYIRVCAVQGQTDTQTAVENIHCDSLKNVAVHL